MYPANKEESITMKCYIHPTIEAIGVCSMCGRGVCPQCAKTINHKLLCNECISSPIPLDSVKQKQYAVLSALLGWLGVINVLLIGIYSTLKLYHLGIMRGYQLEVYIVSFLTLLLMLTLIYGSYHLWQTRFKRGGHLNLIAGIATLFTYGYFTWISPILSELEFVGLLLCVPALISGVLGTLAEHYFTIL
jgi:hypothetical protein